MRTRPPTMLVAALSLALLAPFAWAQGYKDPRADGGSMLTIVNGTYPAGLGEPLNMIISAESDPAILVDSLYDGAFQNYMLSIGLSTECLHAKIGSPQEANLGDGQGNFSQTNLLRWMFGDPFFGSCKETFDGGLHHRYWKQNSTGAWFLAASVEMDLSKQHDIVRNGYNAGRDEIVGNATGKAVPPRTVSNTTTFSGTSAYRNYTYQTDVVYVSGLLSNSSDGINHYITVEQDGYPAIDGLVAVMTVKILNRPAGEAASPTSIGAAQTLALPVATLLAATLLALAASL